MKNLKKSFIVFSMLALTAVPAFARTWIEIGNGHYIDSESIKPYSSYGSYTMDTKYIGKNAPVDKVNGKDVWTIKTYSYIDCKSAYAKTLTITALDADDRVVFSDKNIGKQWYGINNPGSRAYESYMFVCSDKYLNARPGYHNLWWY